MVLKALKIDGDEVGRYTSDELASGVRLGFNAKTPQYRQAQDVAKRHEELRAREAVLRGHHLVRRWLLRNKAPVDDIAAFRVWHDEKVKSGKDGPWDGVPGYLEYWPKRRQVMADLLRDQETVRRQARPVPHRYEIVPVG